MSTLAYIFLPEIPFVTEVKSKEEIATALNEKYPQGKFDSSKIMISRKESKHHAYAQTTQQHEGNLLKLGDIKIGGKTVPLKKCFPNHQIYINKLPDNCSKEEISKYFSNFGKIVDVELFPAEGTWENPKEKSNINHCYIRFADNKDAEKCLFSEERHAIRNNDPIRVVRAYKIGQNDETDKKLFLKITPSIQKPDALKLERDLYNEFIKFGELREKIRIQTLNAQSSKAIITYTSIEAGEAALKNFNSNLEVQPPRSFVLRPFASKENWIAFIGGLKADTTEEKIKKALQKYGRIVSCTINPSKNPGIINAVVTFSDEQSFKLALIDYIKNPELLELFALRPYMDIHMTASLRNDYMTFRKKDKKPVEPSMMNMGGIGIGFGFPSRMNQGPQGFNQPFGMNQLGMGINNPNLGNLGKIMSSQPPTNPNFNRPL